MGSIVEGVKNIGRRIGNAVKELFGIGSRGSDGVGSTTSYDEQTSSVAETYKLQQELSKFRDTVTTVDKGYLAALEKIAGKEAVEKLGH